MLGEANPRKKAPGPGVHGRGCKQSRSYAGRITWHRERFCVKFSRKKNLEKNDKLWAKKILEENNPHVVVVISLFPRLSAKSIC